MLEYAYLHVMQEWKTECGSLLMIGGGKVFDSNRTRTLTLTLLIQSR